MRRFLLSFLLVLFVLPAWIHGQQTADELLDRLEPAVNEMAYMVRRSKDLSTLLVTYNTLFSLQEISLDDVLEKMRVTIIEFQEILARLRQISPSVSELTGALEALDLSLAQRIRYAGLQTLAEDAVRYSEGSL
jgi:hypothetical protein